MDALETFEPFLKKWLYQGQETSVVLINQLYEQNVSAVAVVGCLAAIATGTLSLHLAKKKREWVACKSDNMELVSSNIIYNYPVFGHSLGFPSDPVAFWDAIANVYEKHKTDYPDKAFAVAMFGPRQMVIPMYPEATEHVYKSQTNISKGQFYQFFLPWLKMGLLTSTGHKWKTRRRMLTPAFHKHVLEDYLETMNEKADIMIELIKKKMIKGKTSVEIQHFITLCALDIIVETAMGGKSDLQSLEVQNDYVQAIYDVMAIIQKRQKSVWLWPDLIFKMTADGQKYERGLKILHDFTRDVVESRWADYQQKRTELGDNFETEYFGEAKSARKHRLSFLDTLMQAMEKGEIDMNGCCEEVDTFMFEGHDTTSAAMTWSLQEIGNDPAVLAKCLDEVDRVFGDSDRPASIDDLNNLKYVDACIKEALRKYPSVPIFARELDEDQAVKIDETDYFLRKGSLFVFPDYFLHRDQKHWPNPEQFSPERFLDGNADRRYAYSYTPFSAGSRNCIGQKFAIMEEKVIVSKMLRSFKWKSQLDTNDIPVLAEIITRPSGGCYIDVEDR